LDYHVRTRQAENARVGCKIAIDFRKPFRVFESLNQLEFVKSPISQQKSGI
jgi:hypothetical protein